MKKNCIFVSIASYRDKLCSDTIKSLYDNAKYPKNIYIGICQQNKIEDDDCLKGLDIDTSRIKIIRIPHTEAKGPTYARYLCANLWNQEEYFLQIDSHTKFVKNWDIKSILSIKKLKKISDKPVLSHYPRNFNDYRNYDKNKKFKVSYIKHFYYNKYNIIKYDGARIIDTKNSFIKTPFVTGCMLFAESSFLKEIPFDPTLNYLFTGEEILHSLRFYTYGYDVYIPNQNILFHYYIRNDNPKLWDDLKYYKKKLNTLDKVSRALNSKTNNDTNKILGYYGLGNVKTIEDFNRYLNI
tara:strand:+ start:15873 stop:16760 length:888 start_codon:yes stop_codon:yes gene_type:complete